MTKKTLVIGASLKVDRYSNIVIKRLVEKQHVVKALGIKEGKVGVVKVEISRLNYEGIDTVTLYLNPSHQPEYYDYIISLKPKRVIFNPGTENGEFMALLKQHEINNEIACNLVLLATNQY
jgi:predicted CoA-binding protein